MQMHARASAALEICFARASDVERIVIKDALIEDRRSSEEIGHLLLEGRGIPSVYACD